MRNSECMAISDTFMKFKLSGKGQNTDFVNKNKRTQTTNNDQQTKYPPKNMLSFFTMVLINEATE